MFRHDFFEGQVVQDGVNRRLGKGCGGVNDENRLDAPFFVCQVVREVKAEVPEQVSDRDAQADGENHEAVGWDVFGPQE